MLRYAVLSSLVWSAAAGAQQAPEQAPVPEPPQIPDEVPQGPAIEPEVKIIREKGRVIEEYRVNGQLYKVKVTPTRGKPYYLLYPQGEAGQPVRREIEDVQTPYWLIFSW
ncbi:MAG: DUF2782 domain-containing protein [Gammaproteobacteria bacterium]|nr:DUF2782 domain-containing protein [Gammaproteobacteria bacterium]NIR98459.1 DUF2782 domain-containing protein [Gammaproteobacteria bacterium]NIT64447.1 DUF2782 domain-containing protein [Gammaproteobacteria bacterium]NIV21361.1 DUF2782 domain-containing protein [Gammaproteobacteria bacterium]NIY33027.1 DUF2782 domain-containing protein [Gammaproteobacteria bacterium]